MSGTKALAVIAGATLGLAHVASAQSQVDQSRAYQAEMMRDADARSSYAQGDLSPTLFGQIQIRYTANFRDDPGLDEEFTHGFSNRRTKIGAKGGNDVWAYRVQGNFARDSGGTFALEDAFVDYNVNEDWTVTVGQFKLPLFYEQSMSSTKQLAADRSLADHTFNQGRSQGIMATWDNGENFRLQLALSDGIGTANTDFNSANEADYALSARIDWKDGDWRDLEDFTSEANGNQALRIGAFGHFQDGGSTGGFTMDEQLWILGVDGQWERAGWSAFASAAWIRSEPDGGTETDNFAFVLQGGYRFDERDEIFARGSVIILDDDFDLDDQYELLVGYNHYFDGHATKFTVDAGLFLEATNNTVMPENTSVGILPDNGDPQIALRAQLQVLF